MRDDILIMFKVVKKLVSMYIILRDSDSKLYKRLTEQTGQDQTQAHIHTYRQLCTHTHLSALTSKLTYTFIAHWRAHLLLYAQVPAWLFVR